MAKGNGRVELVQVGLGEAALAAAVALLRAGGYRPTDAQYRALGRAIAAAVPQRARDMAAAPPEQLEAEGRDLGARVVRVLLGLGPGLT